MDPLAGKITPFQRLWHQWKSLRTVPFRRKWFVGYDLEGNTFWEFRVERHGRLRRLVEYHEKRDSLAAYSQKKVHPRWSSWLRFTRPTPPTLAELIEDMQRQEVMKALAQRADQRWREESILEDDKRILHEKILNARAALADKPERLVSLNRAEPKKEDTAKVDDTPIETAHIQPRR